MNDFELSIPAKPDYISLVRQVTEEIALDHTPLDANAISDFVLAVSEATTNAIDAQQRTTNRRPLKIKYQLMSDSLKVEIIDHARGFSPSMIKPLPDVTEPDRLNHEDGLGVYLYKANSDQCDIFSTRRGTTVCLAKFYPTNQ